MGVTGRWESPVFGTTGGISILLILGLRVSVSGPQAFEREQSWQSIRGLSACASASGLRGYPAAALILVQGPGHFRKLLRCATTAAGGAAAGRFCAGASCNHKGWLKSSLPQGSHSLKRSNTCKSNQVLTISGNCSWACSIHPPTARQFSQSKCQAK